MASKSSSIPFGMLTRKFYCHQCGKKLFRHSRTRTVCPGDPDYKKYAVRRHGLTVTFTPGNVEVTEYDFRCPECQIITHYDKQLVIEHIQKSLGKRCLAESEIRLEELQAQTIVNRKKMLYKILWWAAMLILFAIALYFSAQQP